MTLLERQPACPLRCSGVCACRRIPGSRNAARQGSLPHMTCGACAVILGPWMTCCPSPAQSRARNEKRPSVCCGPDSRSRPRITFWPVSRTCIRRWRRWGSQRPQTKNQPRAPSC